MGVDVVLEFGFQGDPIEEVEGGSGVNRVEGEEGGDVGWGYGGN